VRSRMQSWPISLPTGHAGCGSRPEGVTAPRGAFLGDPLSGNVVRGAVGCRSRRRSAGFWGDERLVVWGEMLVAG